MQLDRRFVIGTGFGAAWAAALPASPAFAARRRAVSEDSRPASTSLAGEFGVRPDSGQDETARLQLALDRAAERRHPLVLAPGRYHIRSLRLNSFSRLIGSGSATILKHIGGPALLAADTATDVTVESISLEGDTSRGGGSGSLIALIGVKRVSLCDLEVRSCTGNAISLTGCSGTVTGCRIEAAGKAAIFSLNSDGGMEISHNHISRCANNGILVWKSAKGEDGTIVSTNRIEHIGARDGGSGENGNAINVFRAGGVLVTSNRIADCAYSAVRANSAPDVQIIANNVARMGEVALFVEFAFDGAVVSSNLVDRAAVGISVTNFNEGGRLATVSGNLVRNLFRRNVEVDAGGIGIAVEADTSVCGNTVEGAPTAGIRIGWGRYCRDVVATGNVVRASGIGIAVAADSRAGNVLLASNVISGSRRGAIRAMDHDRPVGEDLAIGGASQQMPRRGLRIEGNMSG
jgi:uncharacterized secreted repeat protein (TIGR03808 family)